MTRSLKAVVAALHYLRATGELERPRSFGLRARLFRLQVIRADPADPAMFGRVFITEKGLKLLDDTPLDFANC